MSDRTVAPGTYHHDGLRARLLENPYPYYHELRAQVPVQWSDFWGGWVLTRYSDVVAALQNGTLSSNRSQVILEQLPEEDRPAMLPLVRAMSLMIGFSDPPQHTRLRSVVKTALNPRVFERLRPRIQQVVGKLLDDVRDRREFDVIRDLAYPLPLTIIADLLGMPAADHAWFKLRSDDFVAPMGVGATTPAVAARAQVSLADLTDYFRTTLTERRRQPRGDLLSALLVGEADGTVRGEEEVIANCVALFIGGHETTTNLIGNGLLALLQHPDQLAKLRSDPNLIGSAVEEFLRYDSPLQRVVRQATADLEIAGQRIRAGELVLPLIGAANRDPAQFPNPDRLDITRSDNRHLAFGYASRFCLGAPLARIEAQIALITLLRRFPNLALASTPPERQPNVAFRGLKSLPVVR